MLRPYASGSIWLPTSPRPSDRRPATNDPLDPASRAGGARRRTRSTRYPRLRRLRRQSQQRRTARTAGLWPHARRRRQRARRRGRAARRRRHVARVRLQRGGRSRPRQARLRGVRAARRTFRANVFAQVKNGPLDFQPREPFHPMFGAMPKTPLMAELQITQEYLGQVQPPRVPGADVEGVPRRRHLRAGPGLLGREVIDGSLDGKRETGIAGVANTGRDVNWTGHDFAQANWYAFGRLAWDPDSDRRRDRGRMDQDDVGRRARGRRDDPLDHARLARDLRSLHDASRPAPSHRRRSLRADARERRSTPRRLVRDLLSPRGRAGVGYDRTRRGSGAVDQYRSPLRELWNDPATTPDELLLWFHRLPWDYRMKSGRTLWDELVFTYTRGAEEARGLETRWTDAARKRSTRSGTRPCSPSWPAGGRSRGVARQMCPLFPGGPRAACPTRARDPVIYLTRHQSSRRRALGAGRALLAEDFNLSRLLQLPAAEMPASSRERDGTEAGRRRAARPDRSRPARSGPPASPTCAAAKPARRSRPSGTCTRRSTTPSGPSCSSRRRDGAWSGHRHADPHSPRQPLERAGAGAHAGDQLATARLSASAPATTSRRATSRARTRSTCRRPRSTTDRARSGPGISLCDADGAARTSRSSSRCSGPAARSFTGATRTSQIKRPLQELVDYLRQRAGLPARRLPDDRHRHRPAGRLLAGARRPWFASPSAG